MARINVQHKLISDEIARITTFKKRKNGLLKKLLEITTLCGVGACTFIIHYFRAKGKKDEPKSEVWPSAPEAIDVLEKFKGLPQKKQENNMLNHETLLDKSLRKMTEKLNDEIEKNKWMKMELMLMENFPPTGEEDLIDYAKKEIELYVQDFFF
ncbi:Agamous-like MADS-box protein AGL90 [Linum perenne]